MNQPSHVGRNDAMDRAISSLGYRSPTGPEVGQVYACLYLNPWPGRMRIRLASALARYCGRGAGGRRRGDEESLGIRGETSQTPEPVAGNLKRRCAVPVWNAEPATLTSTDIRFPSGAT
jgi:hypothetical protein